MKTDTPRTQEAASKIQRSGIGWHFSARKMTEFAAGLERENTRLREVLKFYADKRKYEGPNAEADPDEECAAGYYRLDVTRDGGKKARDILSNEKSSYPKD